MSESTPAPTWGLLLINLGTPASTDVPDVRRYLAEFLSDPRVIDINPVGRALLLHGIILRFRPKASAEAYRTIWTERGSPLLFHTVDLAAKVAERLGPSCQVVTAMRYQQPSIEAGMQALAEAGVDRVVALPLFPHYSSAAWGSAAEEVYRVASAGWNVPCVQLVPPFYDHPAFIEAFAEVGRARLDDFKPDKVLFSYHGVPERHCTKSDLTGAHCLKRADCCDALVKANRNCYRAQCYATTRALAEALGLSAEQHEVSFQSRLGRTPWIQPYTDVRVVELAQAGVKRLAVYSPAFVADCLETLEEIAIRAKEDFQAHGGEDLLLIPSLNAEDVWADGVVRMVEDATGLTAPAAAEA